MDTWTHCDSPIERLSSSGRSKMCYCYETLWIVLSRKAVLFSEGPLSDVQPLIEDTQNKGHNSEQALIGVPNVDFPITFLSSEEWTPLYNGHKWLVPMCPLFGGFTVYVPHKNASLSMTELHISSTPCQNDNTGIPNCSTLHCWYQEALQWSSNELTSQLAISTRVLHHLDLPIW